MNSNIDTTDLEDELYEHYRFDIPKGQLLLRIDKYLMNMIPNATRNKIQNAANSGNIFVNDEIVKSNYKVKPFDVIKVMLSHPPFENHVLPENIPLNIVYEDEALLLVNKEPGLVVHPGHGNYTGTLVNALAFHFENLPMNSSERPGLVHRIDKDTSGLLVVGKTEFALSHLGKQFYDHSIHRRYWALVWGEPKPKDGTIRSYLARDPADRRRSKCYQDEEEGKLAITHYQTLESFYFASLVQCELETGRTHQIRAHFSSIKHPLFSDELYGGSGNDTIVLNASNVTAFAAASSSQAVMRVDSRHLL